MIVFEGLYYCNTTGKSGGGRGILEGRRGNPRAFGTIPQNKLIN